MCCILEAALTATTVDGKSFCASKSAQKVEKIGAQFTYSWMLVAGNVCLPQTGHTEHFKDQLVATGQILLYSACSNLQLAQSEHKNSTRLSATRRPKARLGNHSRIGCPYVACTLIMFMAAVEQAAENAGSLTCTFGLRCGLNPKPDPPLNPKS